jgi:hypothetical protein
MVVCEDRVLRVVLVAYLTPDVVLSVSFYSSKGRLGYKV